MSEQNKATVLRAFEEVWNRKSVAAVDDLYAPDFAYHGAAGQEFRGRDGLRRMFDEFHRAFPDMGFTVEEQVAEGDRVLTRWTFRGTHLGDLGGVEPSGKQVEVTGMSLARVAGGRLVEEWEMADALGLMRQIGTMP